MLTSARFERMEAVLAQRLQHVCCAMESVHHRHNVSAVLRTCDAVGLHDVHLVEGDIEPVRGAAKGAERWLDLHRHHDVHAAFAAIRADGYAVWVADFADPPVPPEAVPLDRPICLWFGAELVGVSAAARAAADGVVTVPMRGFAQSLNISVAAALVLHAVCERVRRELGDRALLSPAKRARVLEQWRRREHQLVVGAAARARIDLELEE